MSRMISSYLRDFGADQPAPVPAPAPHIPSIAFEDSFAFPEPIEVPPVDIDAERAQAYDEGHEAATLALTEMHHDEMEAVKAAHQAELDELKAWFEGEAIARIAADLDRIATAVGLSVSAEAAKALSPIFTELLADKAIDELAKLISASLLDGSIGPITVSGRRAMFDRLAAKVDPDGVLLTFSEADDIDLSIAIGDSVLVTRMSAWADSLKEVLS